MPKWGHPFFVGRKAGKAQKARKENKKKLYALYALYTLYRNPQTHMTSLFLGTQKGEVRSILNVCEELRLAV